MMATQSRKHNVAPSFGNGPDSIVRQGPGIADQHWSRAWKSIAGAISFSGGGAVMDAIERLAIGRASAPFGAERAVWRRARQCAALLRPRDWVE
jgi:hypothetical protein